MAGVPDAEIADLAATVAVTRLVLGPAARIQAPPNLIGEEYALLLGAGIDDWGGVSPLTPDHVNPERPWPQIDELAEWPEWLGNLDAHLGAVPERECHEVRPAAPAELLHRHRVARRGRQSAQDRADLQGRVRGQGRAHGHRAERAPRTIGDASEGHRASVGSKRPAHSSSASSALACLTV